MKYMVCYLLEGDVLKYHQDLTGRVGREFQIRPIYQRMAPHVTLKPPFDTEQIEEVEEAVKKVANTHSSPPITVDGFGHFKRRTIFLDVRPSKEAVELISKLITGIDALEWMPKSKRDITYTLHATVANHNIQRQFDEVWEYITQDTPYFETALSNITILYNENKRWYTYKQFRIV